MKKIGRTLFIFCLFFLAFGATSVFANAITMPGKPELVRKNYNDGTVMIKFKVQWENSWKVNKPNNWDAAWIFAKYKEGGNEWHHTYIDSNSSAHECSATDGAGASIATILKVGMSNVPNSKNVVERKAAGIFVYRKDNGQGSIVFDSICLKWNYRQQGLDDQSVISIKVFSVEMVYVPEGPFYMSDGNEAYKQLGFYRDSACIGPSSNRSIFPAPGKALGNGVLHTSNIYKGLTNLDGYASTIMPADKNPFQDGKSWYREVSNVINLYRNFAWHSPDWYTMYQLAGRSWGPVGQGQPNNWASVRIQMPHPYKATGFWGGDWQSWANPGFAGRGSKDGITWVDLVGYTNGVPSTNNNASTANKHFSIPLDKQDTYNFYEFNWYTNNTYMSSANFTIVDSVPGGDTANAWYYDNSNWLQYTGKTPISYAANFYTFNELGNAKPIVADTNFPTGYKAYYIMKHELSQHAYVDFLNTLTNSQQTTRSVIGPTSATSYFYNASTSAPTWRNWIRVRRSGTNEPAEYGLWCKNESKDAWDQELNGGNLAMCNMNWSDIAAYLCWAGLRPLSEWEYEKAARGNQKPLMDEFVWGNTSYTALSNTIGDISNANLPTETAPAGVNLVLPSNTATFPMRVGVFATNASTRIQAGAGYYGALNMGDNVAEVYVNMSTAAGLKYSGEHGSGELNGNGDAIMKNWPESESTNADRGNGTGTKGCISSDVNYARTSCRTGMEKAHSSRVEWLGCRGGRTAPNK